MSIKIYNAHRYIIKTPEDVGRIHHRMINLCQSIMYQKYVEFIGEAILVCAGMAIKHQVDYSDIFSDFISTKIDDLPDNVFERYKDSEIFKHNESVFGDNYIRSFIHNVSMQMYMFLFMNRNQYSDPCNSPLYTEVSMYYYKNYVLMMTNDTRVNQILDDYPDIEDFSYQNSSDKPSFITEKDWEERLEIWEKATTSQYSKFHFGNGVRVIADDPNALTWTLPSADNDRLTNDIIDYINSMYAIVKKQMSDGIIDTYIMKAYQFEDNMGIVKILNRISDIRRQIKPDFVFKQAQFEKMLDESFASIIKEKDDDDEN